MDMTLTTKRVMLGALLAGLGFAAHSQMPGTGMGCETGAGGKGTMMQHGPKDAAKMQQYMEKRATVLKEKLQLTPAQESAWTTFLADMKPPADMQAMMPDRVEMARLPLPERIDKMKALHAQRSAEMDKRGEAAKTFYAVLTPEQKKVFDEQHLMMMRPGGHRGGMGGMPHNPPVMKS